MISTTHNFMVWNTGKAHVGVSCTDPEKLKEFLKPGCLMIAFPLEWAITVENVNRLTETQLFEAAQRWLTQFGTW